MLPYTFGFHAFVFIRTGKKEEAMVKIPDEGGMMSLW